MTPVNQWAASVIDFSSQYSSSSWSAAQAAGAPDTFDYGDERTAWAVRGRNDGEHSITLGYTAPVYASGVTVRETNGNGFVTRIDLRDTNGVFHTVWTGTDTSAPGSPADFRVSFKATPYLVQGVRVYINTEHDQSTWEEIDAVQLHGVQPMNGVSLAGGIARVGGTSAKDAIVLAPTADGTKLQVTLNGKIVSSNIRLSAIQQVHVFGRDGNDTVTINNLNKTMFVQGGNGTDKLVVNGRSAANNFVLGSSSVTVNGRGIGLDALESLVLKGKTSNDALVVQAAPTFAVSFSGGAGSDRVQGPNTDNTWALSSASAGNLNGTIQFGGVEKLSGGTATDTLVGPNLDNIWSVTGNAGKVNAMAFSGVENLTGGAKNDAFNLANGKGVSGWIDGGAGRNSLNYSAYTTSVEVNLGPSTFTKHKFLSARTASNIIGGISNIRDVLGGSAADHLWGDDKDNVLVGNGGEDFLDGGEGNNVLFGGADDDRLYGGNGRDLLIGGHGSDFLLARGGEDILIGGTTTFETNRAVLDALSAFWNRTDLDFSTRVAKLRAGVPGVPKLNASSVLQDNFTDDLNSDHYFLSYENDGYQDWCFAKLSEPSKDDIFSPDGVIN